MNTFDVIVVGAGNGGLAAAAALARGSKKVALFEKNETPGGVACSFRRGRFDFEVSLHELCGFGRYDKPVGPVRSLFDYLGISDKIAWADVPEAYRLITYDEKDKLDVTMPFGIEAYIDAMEKYVPGSRKSVTDLFDLSEEYLQVINAFGKTKGKLGAVKLMLEHPDFLHTCSMNTEEAVKALQLPEKAARIYKGYWAYLCADCENITFLHYLNMVHSYIELKSAIPKGRSLEMTLALQESFEKNGGTLYLNTEVTEIIIRNKKAVGISTADGRKYYAGDIICNLSPLTVFSSMTDKKEISERDIKKTNARELSGRGFCVFLGLNRSAEELGLKAYSYFIYPDMDTVKQFGCMGHPATNGVQNAVLVNNANPEASPAGTCILTMTTLFSSDYWDNVPDDSYAEEKNAFARKMIADFEKATGVAIHEHIEEMEIAAPATFARYIRSPGGAIYGYKAADWDGILARKLMDKQYSDIKDLEFVGGFGMNLNGYSSAFGTGFDKAKYILRRDGLWEDNRV